MPFTTNTVNFGVTIVALLGILLPIAMYDIGKYSIIDIYVKNVSKVCVVLLVIGGNQVITTYVLKEKLEGNGENMAGALKLSLMFLLMNLVAYMLAIYCERTVDPGIVDYTISKAQKLVFVVLTMAIILASIIYLIYTGRILEKAQSQKDKDEIQQNPIDEVQQNQ